MKRALFIILMFIGAFLVISFFVMPEYKIRILIAFALYLVVFGFVARSMFHYSVSKKRLRTLSLYVVLFIIACAVSIFFLGSRTLSSYKLDLSGGKRLSLSPEAVSYVKELKTDVEIIYIRSVNNSDDNSLFNTLMKEFSNYTDRIKYRSIHPVLNTIEYNEIKNKVSSASPGGFVVIVGDNTSYGNKVSEYEIINAVYSAVVGKRDVCYSYGHGEPALDDYSERGAAIFANIMYDKGINFVPVGYALWDRCAVLVMADPKKDLTKQELKKLLSYDGVFIYMGGTRLTSIRELFFDIGVSASSVPVNNLKRSAFREYDGGVLIDKVSDHPMFKDVSGGIVSSDVYELKCSDCQKLAAVSGDTDSDNKPVLVIKNNVNIFSGENVSSNFFMRFSGNVQFLSGLMNFTVSPDLAFYSSLRQDEQPQLFAVSPRYLDIIFIIVVFLIPIVFLGLSILRR